ncbi:MAG: hypothetical protein CVU34_00035 [Betaproteobacteria bacterium HGW-Betaproteobacteria-7]|jgi:hypothetical protein|uniref:Uncharacterized protein n=1 Tax=Candidatus Anoxymicrobium japonicum TaxID=2013648 RepID=A0A2N3G4K8_9ACTN|nr:MAG: hypothetical protein CVU34_00035 [Betaproteobacteria bacterium HGW-Betaproteobacteria-7]PKQ27657.1 MAG: hypothetical protein CVT63_06810 [Candidatus Anoxymicrobium japonicum]
MISDIFYGLTSYVSQYPTVAIGVVGLFIALNSLMIARWQRDRIFYENLEKSSTFQIAENLKDIERILNKKIGANDRYSLQDILDGNIRPDINQDIENQLSILARYFSEFAANLEKYSANIMIRKKVCFNFQEYGKKARKYYRLFKKYNFEDIGIEFSIGHLKSAGILMDDE